MTSGPEVVLAGNAGLFTLDGTRTFLIGRSEGVVIDPGPDVEDHVRALSSRMEAFDRVTILLTHGHRDHAGAARSLAAATGAEIRGPAGMEGRGVPTPDRVLADGDVIETDAGSLVAVHTPGHTPEHLCFHWLERRALFVGDLLLGRGDTTWVAEYPGCVADYLDSLARLRTLDLDVLFPAHGPPLEDPAEAIERFDAHRRARIEQVRAALAETPGANADTLVARVYGDTLSTSVLGAARKSIAALIEYVEAGPTAAREGASHSARKGAPDGAREG